MKKVISLIALSTIIGSSVFAGGIDSKTNLSSGYHRNPSRNTECERPEAVFYNIGGTGFMADGLYVELGNQFVIKNYSNEFSSSQATGYEGIATLFSGKYEDEEPVLFYPNADIVYKHGKFAFFGGFAVSGGGGTLKFNDGTSMTSALLYSAFSSDSATALAIANDHSLEVYSVTYGETIGAAYQINDKISVAAGLRLFQSQQDLTLSSSNEIWKSANGKKDAGYDSFGWGIGGIFGIHAKPIEKLDIAVQYKTIAKIDVEFNSIKGNLTSTLLSGAEEGDHFYNDMPAELNVGVGYRVIEPLYVNTSFNYHFNKQASMSSALSKDDKIDYDNSWELGGGVDWTINKYVLVSGGLMYAKQGTSSTKNNLFSPVLDSINVGLGVEVKPIENLAITAGGIYVKYFEEDYTASDLNFELNKTIVLFSLGATYRFDL